MSTVRSSAPLRLLRALAADERGLSVIELAIALPILLMLLLGAMDVSQMITAKLNMEQAAQRTTDFALSARPQNSDTAYLIAEAMRASGQPEENVDAAIYLECGGVREVDFYTDCPIGQSRARYVRIAIRQDVRPMVDWSSLGALIGYHGLSRSITVAGDSVVRFQ
jgi:hypothetical protein